MLALLLSTLFASAILATATDPVNVDREPSHYKCPFSMFDQGQPALLQNGATWYCDVDGVSPSCPKWHFCSAGYSDGRSVCCHILGV